MPPLSLLVKPASSLCQMRCRYCFYESLSENREVASYGIMQEETLETLIRQVFAYAREGVNLAFQGGEPTVAGLAFFEKAVGLIGQANIRHIPVNLSLQTNGYAIDRDWARFLKENHVLVGLSMDGMPSLHDRYRLDATGNGTSAKVRETAKLFDQEGVEYNILQVITADAARIPEKLYRYYKKEGFSYLQFIPCLDPYDEGWGSHPWSLTPEGWANFHKGLFDCWYRDFMDGHYISIRYFDNLVRMLLGGPPEACSMQGRCSNQWVVESDGSLYPCDFYVEDRWKIGNIREQSFAELENSPVVQQFIAESLEKAEACRTCPFAPLCRGGCRRERENFHETAGSPNHFCSAYQDFFTYTIDRLQQAAIKVRELRNEGMTYGK